MKVSLKIDGAEQSVYSLKQTNQIISGSLKRELIKAGHEIRDRAKKILETKSRNRTNKKYWTGNLKESIKLNVSERGEKMIGITVGPDMRKAPYAEWVEIGHFITKGPWGGQRGRWWEGYHFMEDAFVSLKDKIPDEVRDNVESTLNKFTKTGGKIRGAAGRFRRGALETKI